MRAAPQRPVRIVPENHWTETRRRSTMLDPPSTESGGSLPRSIGVRSTLNRYDPRGLPWSKFAVPRFCHLHARVRVDGKIIVASTSSASTSSSLRRHHLVGRRTENQTQKRWHDAVSPLRRQ